MNQKIEDELAVEHMHDKEDEIPEKGGGMNSMEKYLEYIWSEIDILKEKVTNLEKKQ
ncbi:MAG: hypothetical protein QGH83_04465 [Candidatus Pacebacteria bacterium]|nr:hypothetical protein [Candidatus Paceibacterota bacterium]